MSEVESAPKSLAQEYLDALDHEVDEAQRTELEDRLSELRQRREKFVEQHGGESGIVQRVDEKIEEVEDVIGELEQSVKQADEFRKDLLDAAVEGFEFNSTWLSPTVLRGLTHALYGEEEESLILEQNRVEHADDLDETDNLTRLDMEHTLLTLVEDRLGRTDTVKEHWERLVESKKYTPFLVVAREGSASPEDVLPELEDEADRKDAKNWLERPIYDWDELVPYYRTGDGEFALSTAGEYLLHNFAESSDEDTEDEVDDESNENDGDGQASLDDIDAGGSKKTNE